MTGYAPPTNALAEWSVVSQMLQRPSVIGAVVGSQLESRDFSQPDTRLLYLTIVELYYADRSVEPLVVGEAIKPQLAQAWDIEPVRVADALAQRVTAQGYGDNVAAHAGIVKRLSTSRQLLNICEGTIAALLEGGRTPEEIGDHMSSEALKVTSGTVARSELMSWMDAGTEYAKQLRRIIMAKQQGIEMAVYTGLPFIDDWTKGIAPTELCFLAGDPGVGKSAVAWKAAEGFAMRQLRKPPEQRVGTLVLSLEMGVFPSTQRVVQSLTGIDGMRLREGDITRQEYQRVLTEWKNRENLPLYFNFASNFRLSQMRALIVEAIRRYNVGFVVIDHFRMLDTDKYISNPNQEDEAKVRFLKEQVAKDLNIAVLCLAHTVKVGRNTEGDSRPRLSDLRGSGQVAAHADFVGFMYKPAKAHGEDAQLEMDIKETDAELLWRKNRHGTDGTAYFTFEPKTMTVRTRLV